MEFLNEVYARARKAKATIVLAEAEDERVLRAASVIEKHGLAKILLLGDAKRVARLAKEEGVSLDAEILSFDSLDEKDREAYVKKLVALRKKHKLTAKAAEKLLQDTKYFAAMLVVMKRAHGYVAGNRCPTADTIRPALQLIGAEKGFASSYFLMLHRKRPLFFADSGFNIDPDAKELAMIAAHTAATAKSYGVTPRVAFLSYSTHGSAEGESVDKVRKALKLAQKKLPKVLMDGELQFDAAFVPGVAKLKAPKSKLKGQANVFIFPDLDSGNIAYKIAQRMAGAGAVGPLLQGLKAPVNDLSRGCSVQDVVDVVAITAASRNT